MNRRLPWILLALVGLAALILGSFGPDGWWALSWLGYPIVGGVLVWKQPENVIGWLLVGIGFGWGFNFILEELINRSLASPSVVWLELLSEPVGMLPWLFLIDLTLIFPSGQARAATTRWLRRTLVLVGAVLFVCVVVDPAPLDFSGFTSPLAIEATRGMTNFVLQEQGFVIVPLLLVFGLISLFVRWRRSEGVERLQLQWFVFDLLVTILLLVPKGLFPGRLLDVGWLVPVVLNLLPLAIGVAILRYRLFESIGSCPAPSASCLSPRSSPWSTGSEQFGCQPRSSVNRPRFLSQVRPCWWQHYSIHFAGGS